MENQSGKRKQTQLEEWFNGLSHALTALALREENKISLDHDEIRDLDFKGNWAIISQDNQSLFQSDKLALIPFTKGEITIPLEKEPEKIEIIYPNRKASKQFEWNNGFLKISVEDIEFNNALLGYLVY